MWPFTKPKTKADAVLEILEAAISVTSEKWTLFSKTLTFKEDVPLRDRITAFLVPASEGLRKNFEPLSDGAEGIILLIVVKGIERSRTHSKSEIESAMGISIPEG
jgi:hypothetical protein